MTRTRRTVRDTMLWMHQARAFGDALLLDGYALTRAASESGAERRSADGHHYPRAVREEELELLWSAYARSLGAERLRGVGCEP